MQIQRTKNPQIADQILKHPDIYWRIRQDYCATQEEFTCAPEIANDSSYYLLAYADDIEEPIGLFIYDSFGPILFEVHAHVLPEYRKSHALNAAYASLDWMFNQTSCFKVMCFIPEVHMNVVGFTRKCGFLDEGYLSNSYLKDNKLHGQYLLGLQRDQFYGVR